MATARNVPLEPTDAIAVRVAAPTLTGIQLGPGRVFLTYLAVFALVALPWLQVAAHGIPINTIYARADTRLLTWILWWVASAVVGDTSGLIDAPINHPAAAQLTGSEHFAALQILFLPAYLASGNAVLAMNVVLFLSYPLAAWAANRLLVALGFTAGVAWVVGFAFALGAHQVPTHVHQLHTLAFYLPAAALALHRLRDTDGARGAALALGAVLLLGCFTAYYTAATLLPVIAIWGVAELLRRRPGRRRFALVACAVVLACLAALAVASVPYLSRARALGSPDATEETVRQIAAMSAVYLRAAPIEIFGGVLLVLALAGCAGLLDRHARRIVLLGLALTATSVFLVCGGTLTVASALPPSPLSDLLLVPVRFFRVLGRYGAIAGLGLALLAAVALQLATRALPRRAAVALLAVVALAVAGERGRRLWLQDVETSAALGSDAPTYDAVARIAAAEGRGPLLELPISSFGYSLQPEAMMGSMRHRLPLVSGHTGYPPPHRPLLDQTIHRLPADDALQDLVDMTRVRWVLLRPARYWADAATLARFTRDLLAADGVGPAWRFDGWTLIAVQRAPVHPEWFDAIARGGVPEDAVSRAAAQRDPRFTVPEAGPRPAPDAATAVRPERAPRAAMS